MPISSFINLMGDEVLNYILINSIKPRLIDSIKRHCKKSTEKDQGGLSVHRKRADDFINIQRLEAL